MSQRLFIGLILGLITSAIVGTGAMYLWLNPALLSAQGEPHDEDQPNEAAKDSHEHEHDEHGHEGHAHEESHDHVAEVRLSEQARRKFGIETATASSGALERTRSFPAQVRLNEDHLAHIVPRVTGVVREVHAALGDVVEVGSLLAVLDSRELAESKAADLAAEAKRSLAAASLDRVETLLAKGIAPEEEVLKARQELAEAEIDHLTAEAKLHALGLSEQQVAALHSENDVDFPRYEIRPPIAGTIIQKHLTLGELADSEDSTFVIADLSTVWVDVSVYPQDLVDVRPESDVRFTAVGVREPAAGTIAYISPLVAEASRSGFARAVLPNPDGQWHPGLFCTAAVTLSSEDVGVLIPRTAVLTLENETVVFVEDEHGFRARPVILGHSNDTHAEILSGLQSGERYVTRNAFLLKAELGKGTAEHVH